MFLRRWRTIGSVLYVAAAFQPALWSACSDPLTTAAPGTQQKQIERDSIKIGANVVAQTFLAPGAGCIRVDSIVVNVLGHDPEGDLAVRILAVDAITGQPTTAQVGGPVNVSLFESSSALSKTAVFVPPVQLEGGKAYAIEVSQPAWNGGNHYYEVALWKANTYSAGKVWNRAADSTAWTSMDSRDFEMTANFSCCPVLAAGCTLSQGYWKNHPETWPVSGLKLGSVDYVKQQLVDIFEQNSAGGNGLIGMAHQLIAAKLNIANGADSTSIAATIIVADGLIGGLMVPPVGSGFLAASVTSASTNLLDAFNNGLAGVPHCAP